MPPTRPTLRLRVRHGVQSVVARWPAPVRRRVLASRRFSLQYNCIFVHIPKTAGTSVQHALESLPGHKPVRTCGVQIPKHARARDIRRLLGHDLWDRFFSFAFVRNPWDLMVSSYLWWVQRARRGTVGSGFDPDLRVIQNMNGFDEFIRSEYGRYYINECRGDIFDWIADENDRIIVDYVGRVETLQDDWNQITQRLGATPTSLPRANATTRTGYRDYYNDATRRIVADRFRRTIETFGYEF